MQQLIIAGNIGKDAVVRRTQSGESVAGFSVAVDNGKDANGNRRDSTWFDCALWGKRGEALAPYLLKGGKVTITGRPTVRVHEGNAYLGVNVDQITLQGGKPEPRPQGGAGGPAAGSPADPAMQSPGDPFGDEVPF